MFKPLTFGLRTSPLRFLCVSFLLGFATVISAGVARAQTPPVVRDPDLITRTPGAGTRFNFERAPKLAVVDSRSDKPDEYVVAACAADGSVNGTGRDVLVVKRHRDGTPVWTARYDSGGEDAFLSDEPEAVVVDSDGNVIVVATVENDDFTNDWMTLKYDSNGNLLWSARFAGDAGGQDLVQGVVVDGAHNVTVLGTTTTDDETTDYATVQYDGATGAVRWTQTYDGGANRSDDPIAIAFDKSNREILVTGRASEPTPTGGSNSNIVTVRYNVRNGNLVRVSSYNSPTAARDVPCGIMVDKDRNVLIAGTTFKSNTPNNLVALKYSPDGTLLWSSLSESPEDSDSVAIGFGVDATGSPTVAAQNLAINEDDIEIATYQAVRFDGGDGSVVWDKRYETDTFGFDLVRGVAVDRFGNVTLTGSSQREDQDTFLFYQDILSVRYDKKGNLLWADRFIETAPPDSFFGGDSTGAVVVLDKFRLPIIVGTSGVPNVTGTANLDLITLAYDFKSPRLVLTAASATHLQDGTYSITATVKNTGEESLLNLLLDTATTLNTTTAATDPISSLDTLPLSLGDVLPGETRTMTLLFPASIGQPPQRVRLVLGGSHEAWGRVSTSWNVILP